MSACFFYNPNWRSEAVACHQHMMDEKTCETGCIMKVVSCTKMSRMGLLSPRIDARPSTNTVWVLSV